jgi:hypothetical protein
VNTKSIFLAKAGTTRLILHSLLPVCSKGTISGGSDPSQLRAQDDGHALYALRQALHVPIEPAHEGELCVLGAVQAFWGRVADPQCVFHRYLLRTLVPHEIRLYYVLLRGCYEASVSLEWRSRATSLSLVCYALVSDPLHERPLPRTVCRCEEQRKHCDTRVWSHFTECLAFEITLLPSTPRYRAPCASPQSI